MGVPRLVSFALLCALGPGVARAQVSRGPEFQVNAYTTSSQYHAAVASEPGGRFLVVWTGAGHQDGMDGGIFARIHGPSGEAEAELRVNQQTAGGQERPAVAFDASGAFVVAWQSDGQDGSLTAVSARRFDAEGAALGGDFQVNTFVTGHQYRPSVGVAAGGQFAIAWTSAAQDGDGRGVFVRRYDAAGVAQDVDLQVNVYTTGDQHSPQLRMTADGSFVVAWTSAEQDGSGDGVFARRFRADGGADGAEFRVNAWTTGAQQRPALAIDSAGGFVVLWSSESQDGSGSAVLGRRFAADGTPAGAEFRVNVHTTGSQSQPAVTGDSHGGFVAVWASYGQDGSSMGVFGRRYDAAGAVDGGEFQVNTYTTSFQVYPVAASQPGGGFVVAWWSAMQDGSGNGVFGRRFATDPIFTDGFVSGDVSAWSAASLDGGDLAVSPAAGLNGTGHGLAGNVDDTAGLYVEDRRPQDEDRYRARFYVDTNGFDPGEVQSHRRVRLFIAFEESPMRRLAALVLRRLGGAYALMGRARLDDNRQADTGFFTIADGEHFVELAWTRSSGPDAQDGSVELWIDGAAVANLTGLDNSLSSVDVVRLGALSVKAGASGLLFWDEFASRRQTYVGP